AFERVGSSVTIGVDVRVIATSNRDLPGEVASRAFRQDLYFRLNVLPVHLPPLRERSEDVPALAEDFLSQVCGREGRPPVGVEPAAMELLRAYPWPGNVRELQNICERAVVLGGGEVTRGLIEPWLARPAATTGQVAPPAAGVGAAATAAPSASQIEPKGFNGG